MTPDLVFAAVTVIGIAAAYHAFRTWVADRALARGSSTELALALRAIARDIDEVRAQGVLQYEVLVKRLDEARTTAESLTDVADQYVTKDMQKALAEDWFRKFQQLERDINVVKSHTESQLAGTLAAVGANTSRGFNR